MTLRYLLFIIIFVSDEVEENEQDDMSKQKIDSAIATKYEISIPRTSAEPHQEYNNCEYAFNFNDPGTWPKRFSDSERCYVTKMRAENQFDPDISKSYREGRNLTKDWFFKDLKNGMKVRRSWLGYSVCKNALYCVPCRFFSYLMTDAESKLSFLAREEGFVNWKKLNEKLPDHENSQNHKLCFCSWKSLETSLGKGGIDKELQIHLQKEESHWRAVLHCIIDAIIFLAKQGSPFRGTKEVCDFGDPDSGKFLNTIDLISHYSAPLSQHIERHKKGQISYFSQKIQDEFLDIIAKKIREDILKDVLSARYFSLMFDCTPDISHNEQMTQVIRYIKVNTSEVVESFVDFFKVIDKTGEGLCQEILQKIEQDGLNIRNCRGQSYDNGANMAGKYKGVQSRILEKNELAYFVPCAAHSLNLVGAHAADTSAEAQTFFGTIHSLYLFFAASTSRWEIFQKHVPTTLKSQSKTRWSARKEAVEAVYKHFDKVIKALEELKTHFLSTPETKTEANSILKNMKKLEFIAFTCFWYAILKQIDHVNKFLQREDLTIDKAAGNIQGLLNFMKNSRDFSSSEAICEAKFIADNNDVPVSFSEKRKRKKKKMFDELCEDQASEFSNEDLFRMSLLEILDRIITELSTRFTALENINNKFGFLSGVQIHGMEMKDLKNKAAELADTYTEDLNKEEFMFEIESFKYHAMAVEEELKHATASVTLNLIYVNKLEEGYPNITTALRIFLTVPVSVSSGERSFSKLKLIKYYLTL